MTVPLSTGWSAENANHPGNLLGLDQAALARDGAQHLERLHISRHPLLQRLGVRHPGAPHAVCTPRPSKSWQVARIIPTLACLATTYE